MTGRVSSIRIPVTSLPYYTGTLGVVNGHVVVGDETGGTKCQLAVVDPISLKLISNGTTSCLNPELSGEPAVPIESIPRPNTQTGIVRISTYDEKTKAFHLGPVVLQYGNFSDTRPEWTYGGGSLWIFDAEGFTSGTFKNGRAVLLRISLATGKVLGRFAAPPTDRILLAADGDGLWFAPSVESGWPIHTARPSSTLYFLGNGAKHPVVVSRKGLFVGWLVASGHVALAYFVESTQTGAGEVDTFNFSPEVPATTVVHVGANVTVPREIGEEAFDAEPVLIIPGYRLLFVWPLYSSSNSAEVKSERIFLFDPDAGQEMKVATIPSPPYEYAQPNIIFDGSLYLLVGTSQAVKTVTLYRVHW
ncbi:MAG TPA: hypothetical protein VKR27_02765 [Acidimicrobiales bacterium]|nr:hypothetical protein [Acidimicrobiales bacterium]